MKPLHEKAGSGRSRGKRRDTGAAGDKSAPISDDAGRPRGGKKKKREAKSHWISRTLHGTDKEKSSRSTASVLDESELIRAVAAVDERASGVEALRAELEMMLQDQLRIEDSLRALTGIERSRSSEALACLRESEKQVEFLKGALETERGQSLSLAQKAEDAACRLKDLEAARNDLAHGLTEAEARELSLRTALDEAERAGLAAKEQLAEVRALLSKERQRTAELAGAVAATENLLRGLKATLAATESKLAEELTRAQRAESEQASIAGKLRQKATEADARAEDAGIKVSTLEAKTAHLERDIERHEQAAAALLNSTSWRLSAPWRSYRRMVSRLHRLLRGKKMNPLFDREWYLQQYPDVKESEIDSYDHFLRHGAAEGRDPSPLFDTSWYLKQNPSVNDSGENPLVHFYSVGAKEGHDPITLFDVKWYLEQNADVRSAGTNPLRHFIDYGSLEGRNPNPFFDTSWYLAQNPDVARLNLNPLVHYRTIGAARGSNPSPRFDVKWYLDQYADVARSGMEPLDHFLEYGRSEGRAPTPNYGPRGFAAVTDADIYWLKAPALCDEVALFVAHSPDGHLKPHVRHYLNSLKRQGIATILIVAADAAFSGADSDLIDAMNGVFVRRNEGYDFAAWAHVLRLTPELFNAKILYLLNDSLIGPTNDHAFQDLLTRIRTSPLDFVGLTESYEICWHIQSYFLAIKQCALSSTALHKFIDGIGSYRDKNDVIKEYEVQFASILKAAGLNCGPIFPSSTELDNRTIFHWKDLLKSGFPFIKVTTIRDSYDEVDTTDWRELLAAQGYDVSLAERTLADAATSSRNGSLASVAQRPHLPPPLSALESSYAARSRPPDPKTLHVRHLEGKFQAFLDSSKRFDFPYFEKPTMSIVLVLFNQAHFTFACLESLHACLGNASFSYEIIVYDNASTDLTSKLLERCDNLIIRQSDSNLGFLQGVNSASDFVRGHYLLLLNNDTQMPAGTLENALRIIEGDAGIGAVGARLILPDGSLQEAGSIIWSDGTCLGYCRGCDADHFEANFRRDVDYCSGAFLLTRTALFRQLGRFNPTFMPAYYEETDYCMRLREAGFRIVYDPSVFLFHFEFASAKANASVFELQRENQAKFKSLHEETLRLHLAADPRNVLFARQAGRRRLRLLFVDDFVPHDHLGAGFPRARKMIDTFLEAGAQITLCPTQDQWRGWDEVRKTLDPSIEVAFGVTADGVAKFIKDRRGFYDAVLVSRPHNMFPLNDALKQDRDLLAGRPLIYDAEALFTDREIQLRRLRGETVTDEERERLIDAEVQIGRFASTILCISDREYRYLAKWRDKDIHVLGHTIQPLPSMNAFEDRRDVLFVGAIHADYTPNADSVVWFIDRILPILRKKIARPFKFIIAGLNKSSAVKQRLGDDIVATGSLQNLTPLYVQSRIFVAPTRFAAGVPHKVHEAAARGIPSVVTPLLAEQLGWTPGRDLLTGPDPEAFAEACADLYTNASLWTSIRDNALEAVKRDCDPLKFADTVNVLHAKLFRSMQDNLSASTSDPPT